MRLSAATQNLNIHGPYPWFYHAMSPDALAVWLGDSREIYHGQIIQMGALPDGEDPSSIIVVE